MRALLDKLMSGSSLEDKAFLKSFQVAENPDH